MFFIFAAESKATVTRTADEKEEEEDGEAMDGAGTMWYRGVAGRIIYLSWADHTSRTLAKTQVDEWTPQGSGHNRTQHPPSPATGGRRGRRPGRRRPCRGTTPRGSARSAARTWPPDGQTQ